MKRLYAPWRTNYTKDVSEKKQESATKDQCIFCTQFAENADEKHFIIRRFKHNVVMLNLYPYNAGHLLILPKEHIPTLELMCKDARSELIELTTDAHTIVKSALECDGANIGLNIGKAGGAGIPSHLHMHVLPRWQGDTNFFPIIAETKMVSYDLPEMFKTLKTEFDKI